MAEKDRKPHYVGRFVIERVEYALTAGQEAGARRHDQANEKAKHAAEGRTVYEVAQVTAKATDLDTLKGHLVRHIEIVEDI